MSFGLWLTYPVNTFVPILRWFQTNFNNETMPLLLSVCGDYGGAGGILEVNQDHECMSDNNSTAAKK